MLHGNLSSGLTVLFKYLFLPVWSGIFGYVTFQLFANPDSVTFNGIPGGAPPGIEWLFLAMWGVGTGFLALLASRLRSVRVYGDSLYCSAFGHELEIQRQQLIRAEQLPWLRPVIIRIVPLPPRSCPPPISAIRASACPMPSMSSATSAIRKLQGVPSRR